MTQLRDLPRDSKTVKLNIELAVILTGKPGTMSGILGIVIIGLHVFVLVLLLIDQVTPDCLNHQLHEMQTRAEHTDVTFGLADGTVAAHRLGDYLLS